MGCDIHYTFQRKNENNQWVNIVEGQEYGKDHYIHRNYLVFSILANVRNGYGFADTPTYVPVVPISEPRGMPVDMDYDVDYEFADDEEDVDRKWYGDHSHSYVTSDEILDYFKTKRVLSRCGVIPLTVYYEWDGVSQPDSWCGSISGPNVLTFDSQGISNCVVPDYYTHIKIEWKIDLEEAVCHFVESIKQLHAKYGVVRLVFGFDS